MRDTTELRKQMKAVRAGTRAEAIREGRYGRPPTVIPDKKKVRSKRLARGKVHED